MLAANAKSLSLGCTILPHGKKGVLRQDEHGYFLAVPMGAYNAFNPMGYMYEASSGLAQLAPNSIMQRRCQKGGLYAEWKHPVRERGWTDAEYITRIRDIDMDRVCCHIRRLYTGPGFDENGRPIIMVYGEVKPFGPFEKYAYDALTNPCLNSFFSVRCLTLDDHLKLIKYTRETVTYDMVGEGGILQANKFASPSLEHFKEQEVVVPITQDVMWELIDIQNRQKATGVALEHGSMDFEALAAELGWKRHKPTRNATPAIARW